MGGGRRNGNFTSVAEREAFLFNYLGDKINKDKPQTSSLPISDQFDRHESIAYLQQRLHKNHKNAMVHGTLAPLLLNKGDIKHAIQHYQCAVSYNPNDLNAWTDLADVLFKVRENGISLDAERSGGLLT